MMWMRRGMEPALALGRVVSSGTLTRGMTAQWVKALGMAEEHGIAQGPAEAQQVGEPSRQLRRVGHRPHFHRLLQAVGIAEGAHRIGRREPGHEAVEGPVAELSVSHGYGVPRKRRPPA